MDEQSRRNFLTRYASLALSALTGAINGAARAEETASGLTDTGRTLLSQQEPPVAVYGPPPTSPPLSAPGPKPPQPRPPAPVYGPPPRANPDRHPPVNALYGPPSVNRLPIVPVPGGADGGG